MKNRTSFFSLFIILIAGSSCNMNSRQITVTGRIDSLNGMVSLLTEDFRAEIDSVPVENNQFSLTTNIPEDGFYMLKFAGSYEDTGKSGLRYRPESLIYLEKDKTYKYTAEGPYAIGQRRYVIQSGSAANLELNKFTRVHDHVRKRLEEEKKQLLAEADVLLESGDNEAYKWKIDLLNKHVDVVKQAGSIAVHEFIAGAESSVLIPYLISRQTDHFEKYYLYKKALESLNNEHKANKYFENASEKLKSVQNLHVGGVLPLIYGSDTDGNSFRYNFSKNQYTLVNVWAAWSPASRHDMVDLKKVYNKYKDKGFDIVGVSVDSDNVWWKRISKYDSIPWYHVSESLPVKDSQNVKTFKAQDLPLNFLIDGNKRVITKNIEADELDDFLAEKLR